VKEKKLQKPKPKSQITNHKTEYQIESESRHSKELHLFLQAEGLGALSPGQGVLAAALGKRHNTTKAV